MGGGNTKSALAVWREWGLDRVLVEAWRRGILLSGMSAGAMCWFEEGLTNSYWCANAYQVVAEHGTISERAYSARTIT